MSTSSYTRKPAVCPLCTASMRTDHYGEHLLTHLREILVRDKAQREEAIEDKSVCVYLRHLRQSPTAGPQMLVSFACCLACGKWEQNVGRKGVWRVLHERWCATCKKPHQGPGVFDSDPNFCQDPTHGLPRPQHSKQNDCEDFCDKHNSECCGGFDRVSEWFDLTKPKPKSIPVVRKTAQKRTVKPKTETSAPAPAPAPAPAAPTLPTSSVIPLVVRAFPDVFDHYDYETDDDSDADEDDIADAKEQRHTQRAMTAEQMIAKAGDSFTKLQKRCQNAAKLQQKAVADAVERRDKEIDAMEQKLFRKEEECERKDQRIQQMETGRDSLIAELQRLRQRMEDYGVPLTDE